MIRKLRRWLLAPRVDLSCVNPRFLRRAYSDAEWSPPDLRHFVPVSCRFERCKFEDAEMLHTCFGGGLEDTVYVNCSFDRSSITGSGGNARFISCSFRDVNIYELYANSVEMIDCKFSGIVRNAAFIGVVPRDRAAALGRARNKFQGNDFSEARLFNVELRNGIDLTLQKLPPEWQKSLTSA